MNHGMKMVRCAACGSTDVTEEKGVFRCRTCGSALDHGMSAGDLERIQRTVLMGGDREELQYLRTRYKNLDIATWSRDSRLQV